MRDDLVKKIIGNNEGSTLILLVMAIAIISLLGTSILGVTMMNLKIKKTNTNIKQTFYLSESGLDNTYDKAHDLVAEAVNYGNNQAQSFINDVTEKFTYLNLTKPETPLIEDRFKECIEIKDLDAIDNTYTVVLHNDKVSDEAEKIYVKEYKNYLSASTISGLNDASGNPKVDVQYDGWIGADENSKLKLSIDSSYTLDGKITKETGVNLLIGVPTYNETYTVSTNDIPQHPLWANALIAEDVEIKGQSHSADEATDVHVNGDVYILNDLNLNATDSKSKFDGDLVVKGGVDTDTDKGILFNKFGSKLSVRNVYTKNIIMDATDTTFETAKDNNYSIYVKDDLEMNNSRQKVDIKGSYYGFSFGGETVRDNALNSAIIINSNDIATAGGSSINISDELYLFGTSYIKDTPFATGESISITGNYVAYTMPLTGGTSDGESLTWDNIDTVHYSPLPPLADKFKENNKDMQPWNKGDYFKEYNDEYGGINLTLRGNNIVLGPYKDEAEMKDKVKTLGIAIDGTADKEVIPSSFTLEFLKEVESSDSSSKKSIYESKVNEKLKYDDNIYFDDLNSCKKNKVVGNELVYIDNAGITIKDGKIIGGINDGKYVNKGLIVTNGDVNISGTFDFSGSIISGGKITIDILGSETDVDTVGIVYDKSLVAKIIEEEELYNNIFKVVGDSDDKFTITSYTPATGGISVEYSSFLEFEDWKMK